MIPVTYLPRLQVSFTPPFFSFLPPLLDPPPDMTDTANHLICSSLPCPYSLPRLPPLFLPPPPSANPMADSLNLLLCDTLWPKFSRDSLAQFDDSEPEPEQEPDIKQVSFLSPIMYCSLLSYRYEKINGGL